jgi:cation diffusion facilitator family transporter
MRLFSSKSGVVKLALGVVIGLITLKVVVAYLTDSISITAQATDSFLDLFSIGITFLAIRMAGQPADEEHPFGHGKMEGISAVVQAVIVIFAAFFIVSSSIQRIIQKTTLELTEAGIAVMAVSIIASIFLSRRLQRVSKETESTALEALAKNINADIYSALGVLVGLVVVRFTKVQILDPIIAIVMVVFILKGVWDVVMRSFRELTDYRLPREEQEVLIGLFNEHRSHFVSFHDVRSRRAGSQRFVDLHLIMPRNVSVEKAHDMCDHLEQDIKNRLPNASVVIHVEPCIDKECLKCLVSDCNMRRAGRKASSKLMDAGDNKPYTEAE